MQLGSRKDLWTGVLGGLILAGVLALSGYAFNSTIRRYASAAGRNAERKKLIESALGQSTNTAPFAYGIAQAVSVRYFILAVTVGCFGQVLSFIWPINLTAYLFAIPLLFASLRRLEKIEVNAMKTLDKNRKP